jgi:nitrite reductase (cytochrome c-552)
MRTARGKKLLVWVVAVAVIAAIAALAACAPKQRTTEQKPESMQAANVAEQRAELSKTAPSSVPAADEFGVIRAEAWKDIYPNEYNSYLKNAENVPPEYAEVTATSPDNTSAGISANMDKTSTKMNYLETNPEIKTLGKGYGYAKYYTEPAGHTYSIWSIEHNGRLGDMTQTKGILACYACKTPQIHFDAESQGGNEAFAWKTNAGQGVGKYTENVSCANCHVNDDPTKMNIIRADWKRVMGSDWESNSLGVPQEGMVCGQCHCDYSMALGEIAPYNNGEPTSPYEGGLDSITPEKALKFYDDYGFSDWTYASTGAKMLSVRHAEFEFYYAMDGGSKMFKQGYNCADCHMPLTKADDGSTYTSHHWISPLENEELVKNDCNTCHGDIAAAVKEWQADIDGRTTELGRRAANFIKNLEAKVAKDVDGTLTFDMETAKANGLSEDQVAQLQKIQREACYYWNLAAAENSEGAHNKALYNRLLEEGNKLLDEGDKILGVESSAAKFVAE